MLISVPVSATRVTGSSERNDHIKKNSVGQTVHTEFFPKILRFAQDDKPCHSEELRDEESLNPKILRFAQDDTDLSF